MDNKETTPQIEPVLGPKEEMSIENLSKKLIGRAEFVALYHLVENLEKRVADLEKKLTQKSQKK